MAYLNGKRIGIHAYVICDTDASYLAGHLAGQKSMAVPATATGNPAICDYVHPTEHEIGITLTGKNLFNLHCEKSTPDPADYGYETMPRKFINGTYVVGMTRANAYQESRIYSCSFQDDSLTINGAAHWGVGFPMKLLPNTKYIFSCKLADVTKAALACMHYDEDGVLIKCDSSYRSDRIAFTTDDFGNVVLVLLPTVLGEDITFTNVQLELGHTVTGYTPYIADFSDVVVYSTDGEAYKAESDGLVLGVRSTSPSMEFHTDAEGVVITAQYWLDTKSKLTDMETALLELGGSL